MADLSLNLNPASMSYYDLVFSGGDLVLTSDANPSGTNNILQNILQRMRFFLGEWFLDLTQGLPYLQQILIKNPNQSNVDAIFLNCIAGTPGVMQIQSYSFSLNRALRVLSVSFSCVTTQGIVNYTGSILPIGGGNV